MDVRGPERPGGQGLDSHQQESGNRAILALLEDREVADQVDLVLTCRDDAYEVWARRGMLRFRRVADADGPRFETLEQLGENPLEPDDPRTLATLAEELASARTDDPERCFLGPGQVSYPFAQERIAQLFDSPFAPDLAVSPRADSFGIQPGQHGALDCVQSRAPLAFAGPGVRPGRHPIAARHVDVAPTLCRLLDFPKIEGRDGLGRPARTWLARQDGRALEEIVSGSGPRAERVYFLLLDGLSHTELLWRLEEDPDSIPHLRSILDRSALLEHGSFANFPTITWPSHSTLVTGAWCGHHDVVNPAYYVRERREMANPQGQLFQTEGFLSDGVETLYEAFRRARGAFTAAINAPQGRGADHASLERRVLGDRTRLRALTEDHLRDIDPRWQRDGKEHVQEQAVADARGMAQVELLFDEIENGPPAFTYHELALTDAAGHDYGPHSEGLRAALDETDVRIGKVLEILRKRGLLDETLFVVTSDHGMAQQRTELAANPARHPERIGMRAVTAEPMIWLRDLRVELHRAADGRTLRLEVLDNDPTEGGEHPPVAGARVDAFDHPDRHLATANTDAHGGAALVLPPDVPSDGIAIRIEHADFNPRNLLADGTSLAPDPRRLYR